MLRYGGVSTEEQEVVIRLGAADGKAHVCSTWPAWSRKFEKPHGCPPKYQERDNFVTVAFWILPLEAIRVRKGKTQLSDTERVRRQAARFGRPAPCIDEIPGKVSPKKYPTASKVLAQ